MIYLYIRAVMMHCVKMDYLGDKNISHDINMSQMFFSCGDYCPSGPFC